MGCIACDLVDIHKIGLQSLDAETLGIGVRGAVTALIGFAYLVAGAAAAIERSAAIVACGTACKTKAAACFGLACIDAFVVLASLIRTAAAAAERAAASVCDRTTVCIQLSARFWGTCSGASVVLTSQIRIAAAAAERTAAFIAY